MPPVTVSSAVPYPGRYVKVGERDPEVVLHVQRRLNETGCGPLPQTGLYDLQTARAVKRFQARFTDMDGQPLVVDGVVGPLTWASMFGVEAVPGPAVDDPPSIATAALAIARSQIGVCEHPAGSNRGPKVDEYVRCVGLSPTGGFAWCAAFVYWCFEEAARREGRPNPVVKTAGVLSHWNKARQLGIPRIAAADAIAQPGLIRPGHVFIMDYGGGVGHTGMVAGVRAGKLVTIEGNTNDGGSREGIGVFERDGRKIVSINKGFLDYSGR